MRRTILLPLFAWFAFMASAVSRADLAANFQEYDPACRVSVRQQGAVLSVRWPIGGDEQAQVEIDLAEGKPLLRSIGIATSRDAAFEPFATLLDPVYWVRVGDRDLKQGWTVFFDRMQEKPNEVFRATLKKHSAIVTGKANRATVTLGDVTAGPFRGELRWTFFAGDPLVLQEAVLSTDRDATAFLYDAGLAFRDQRPERIVWREAAGGTRSDAPDAFSAATNLAVAHRAVAAQFKGGSLAIFPPPHRYFYPLDYSTNLKNIWAGPGYGESEMPFGLGVRHDPRGDNRFVPWFNAPPGTKQELGLFWLVSRGSGEAALRAAGQWTRNDRFAELRGHRVFTSHYHVEHTQAMLDAQREPAGEQDQAGRLSRGSEYRIPARMVSPGFARVFREMGIDIAHLAEFHFGHTPRMPSDERLHHLDLLHAECRRLSDDSFLLLPGEEPNVHLGGHWISLFPKPVNWVLNRPDEKPFVADDPERGRVYHVGSEADVYRLLQMENGLAWTAHPRIKSSFGFPDKYRRQPFFESEHFLGAAWKAMPGDLSIPRLGTRVLDLLDDMSNWGAAKQVLGEVDVFQIEPDHELYAHMNVNYLRLDKLPRFDDGWQSVLDVLRDGKFFVTTGEVLIPRFTVNGIESGDRAQVSADKSAEVKFELAWTFPLAFAEVISGDGRQVQRHRIDLSDMGSFGTASLTEKVDLAGARWVRLEVWDIATSGAFTQPVWLEQQP